MAALGHFTGLLPLLCFAVVSLTVLAILELTLCRPVCPDLRGPTHELTPR